MGIILPLSVAFFAFPVDLSRLTVPIFPVVEAAPLTVSELQAIATSSAAKYHLTKRQTRQMLATVNCESGWVATSTGDYGTSIGIAQIHLPAHQDISKDQALDPYFSLDWAAYQFSIGNQAIWTCWREIFS